MRLKAEPTIKVENSRVRVTEWFFRLDAETGFHRHEFDYVVVPMVTGTLLIVDKDGKESFSSLVGGEPYFGSKGVEHNVINDSGKNFSFIEIELLQTLNKI